MNGPGECEFIGSVQIISERLGSEGPNGTGMLHSGTICKASGCAVARASSSDERVREIATTVALNVLSRDEVAARPIPLCRRKKSTKKFCVVSGLSSRTSKPACNNHGRTYDEEKDIGRGGGGAVDVPVCQHQPMPKMGNRYSVSPTPFILILSLFSCSR